MAARPLTVLAYIILDSLVSLEEEGRAGRSGGCGARQSGLMPGHHYDPPPTFGTRLHSCKARDLSLGGCEKWSLLEGFAAAPVAGGGLGESTSSRNAHLISTIQCAPVPSSLPPSLPPDMPPVSLVASTLLRHGVVSTVARAARLRVALPCVHIWRVVSNKGF